MSACATLTTGINPGCAAIKKVGGVDKRVWIGETKDIDITAITFGSNDEVTAFDLISTKTLKKFIGKNDKHSGKSTPVPGVNVALWNQEVSLVLYIKTAAERKAYADLCEAEDLFIIMETNAGDLEVYGISCKGVDGIDSYGLKMSGGEKGTGVLKNDDTSAKVTLAYPEMPNMDLLFIPATVIGTNITALDALSA